jgi:hypothetical protein
MSLKLKNTEKYLKEYTKGLLDITIKELDKQNRIRKYNSQTITSPITASGSLKESLNIVKKKSNSILHLNIEGNAYGEQVDEGTSSISVSKGKLIQWINNKTGFKDLNGNVIDLSNTKNVARIAGLISKSLKLNGIKPTNFLTDIVNSKIIDLKNINNPIIKDLELNVDDILIKSGYKKKGEQTYVIQAKIK